MDNTWTRGRGSGRGGRGRGRGGGGFDQRRSDDYYHPRSDYDPRGPFDKHNGSGSGGSSTNIFSRLGPIKTALTNAFQDSFQSHQGDAFRDNAPRGGGGGGGGRRFNNDRLSFPQQRGGTSRGRGGRRQYTRELMDEDIEMEPVIQIAPGSIVVVVSGFPKGSEQKLMGFLQRKAKRPWQPLEVREEYDTLYIALGNDADAEALCRMNGYTFGSSTINIRRVGDNNNSQKASGTQGSRQQRGGRSNVLQEFLQERWDEQQGFLSMDDLPPTSHSIVVVISKLLRVAQELWGNKVVTLSFARNKLWSLKPLSVVPTLFPGLKNLSVQENEISEFKGLDPLSDKLPQLTELMLLGNPIQTQHNWNVYQSEVSKRFPTIKMLDQQPVAPLMSSSISFGTASLPPVKPSFFDQDSSRQAAQDLLSKFFPLFDSNRAALLDLYDTQSAFSIAVSRTSFAQNSWGQGLPAQHITVGNDSIIKRMQALPPTMHDLTRPENFMTDGWQTAGSRSHPVILFLVVHGQFSEATGAAGARYSFDRAFIVAPSQPGSRAQMAGWHYVILSDSLTVRDPSGNAAFQTSI